MRQLKILRRRTGAGTRLCFLVVLFVMALGATSQTGKPPPPRLTILHYSRANGLTLRVQGTSGRTNVVEASTDLVSWTPVSTNVMDYSLCPICPFVDIQDPASTNLARRFYRAYELL